MLTDVNRRFLLSGDSTVISFEIVKLGNKIGKLLGINAYCDIGPASFHFYIPHYVSCNAISQMFTEIVMWGLQLSN